jgi:CelD/BcsL family acetyltransferase involved in cellulose biosynthesis
MVGHLKTRFRRLRLNLGRIAASSDLCLVLPHVLEKHRLIHIRRESYGSPYLRIDRSWSEFLESKSRHFRSELKRKRKGIEKAGRVEFVKHTQPEQCAAAMQEVLHIERNSWKEQNGTSFTAGPGLKEFYSDLAVRCARAGVLCIYTLRFESEPIAHVYGIPHGHTYYALKTSYCESHKHLSPGVVLFNHCLHDVFDSGLTEFNFLGDESRWKNELASEVRPYVRMTVCPRTLLSRLRQCIDHRIKPYLKARLAPNAEAKRRLETLRDTTW